MICDLCCINCIKSYVFKNGLSFLWGQWLSRNVHCKRTQGKILPCSSNHTFSVWLKTYSIYFILWLLDFEEENIRLCIKTRYQGVLCSGRCINIHIYIYIYIEFWHIVETHKLCASVFEICQWCGVKSAIRPWRQTSCTRFLLLYGEFNYLSGHLFFLFLKVIVEWFYRRSLKLTSPGRTVSSKSVYSFENWGVALLKSISGGVCCCFVLFYCM